MRRSPDGLVLIGSLCLDVVVRRGEQQHDGDKHRATAISLRLGGAMHNVAEGISALGGECSAVTSLSAEPAGEIVTMLSRRSAYRIIPLACNSEPRLSVICQDDGKISYTDRPPLNKVDLRQLLFESGTGLESVYIAPATADDNQFILELIAAASTSFLALSQEQLEDPLALQLIRTATHTILNASELRSLMHAETTEESLSELSKEKLGTSIVVCTDSETIYTLLDGRIHKQAVFRGEDRSGYRHGDTFSAAYIFATMNNIQPLESVRFAAAAAAYWARNASLPSASDVEQFLLCHDAETGLEIAKRSGNVDRAAAKQPHTVLVVVAHPDDELIGCGGTIAELAGSGVAVHVAVMAASNPVRAEEARRAANALGVPSERIHLFDLPDRHLPENLSSIESLLRNLDRAIRADVVFTHRCDSHPDHGAVYSATLRAFAWQSTSILKFTIPQPASSGFCPTVYIRLSDAAAQAKLNALTQQYRSQSWKGYFDTRIHDGAFAQAGISAGCSNAESFELERLRLRVDGSGTMVIARRGEQPNFVANENSIARIVCELNSAQKELVVGGRVSV
ncbi:MAG: PIG-L family deacetylase [Planctomycetaceae bacterium]|nr:PIG-L family deacetylase [Planctomycetaceae bacterium]